MASPTLPALLLAFLFLVVAAAPGAGAFDEHVEGDGRFLLLDCGDGSGTASKNSSANVADLLAALPSAATPEGSAVLSRGGAFARGVCIGNDSSPEDCRACLAAAARNITGGCGGPTGRRGGAWSDGCFLAYYADAAAARDGDDDRRKVLCDGDIPRSYLDDGDRGRLFVDSYYYSTYPDPTFFWLLADLAQRAADEPTRTLAAGEQRSDYNHGMTVRALAQCTGDDRADCLRCLKGSAYQAALSCGGAGAGWLRGGRVLSYGCYMRFEVSYRCGNPVQPDNGKASSRWGDCSSASAPATASGGGALLRWLAGGLVAAVLLCGLRGM
ncbi:hypothetical protein SEVIR_3G233300v4 [Setaria viridis]|uniref:Gnk2-homologous domain-containing protein n=1 Tax=Setaria viridis TaxID=4556 RepID=A0A4U6VCP0_SETVI|nr:hypothetical protein SEVIR_3G233300v2 [Setaria viridis]